MSEGPIKRERAAWEPPRVSTPNSQRVCYRELGRASAYCGRLGSETVNGIDESNCADCTAALRADGVIK